MPEHPRAQRQQAIQNLLSTIYEGLDEPTRREVDRQGLRFSGQKVRHVTDRHHQLLMLADPEAQAARIVDTTFPGLTLYSVEPTDSLHEEHAFALFTEHQILLPVVTPGGLGKDVSNAEGAMRCRYVDSPESAIRAAWSGIVREADRLQVLEEEEKNSVREALKHEQQKQAKKAQRKHRLMLVEEDH